MVILEAAPNATEFNFVALAPVPSAVAPNTVAFDLVPIARDKAAEELACTPSATEPSPAIVFSYTLLFIVSPVISL